MRFVLDKRTMASWWRKNVIEPIHNTRIPLGARGRFIMGWVYFLGPLAFGIPLMQWAIEQSQHNLGKDVSATRELCRGVRSF